MAYVTPCKNDLFTITERFFCALHDWSRAMLHTRKDRGNDVMVAPFVFLFLTRAILRVTLTEMDVKTANVTVKKIFAVTPPASGS